MLFIDDVTALAADVSAAPAVVLEETSGATGARPLRIVVGYPHPKRRGDAVLVARELAAGTGRDRGVAKTVEYALLSYPWPGNLDELETVAASATSANGPSIEVHDLPAPRAEHAGSTGQIVATRRLRDLGIRHLRQVLEEPKATRPAPPKSQASVARIPELEAGHEKIVIEPEGHGALRLLHDREAHRVGVGDALVRQPSEPGTRGGVMGGGRKDEPHDRARLDTFERRRRGTRTGAEQEQSMHLGQYEGRRQHRDAVANRPTKQGVGPLVVLVACAQQRDPRATIDEDAAWVCWSGAGACHDRPVVVRRRRSRRDAGRNACSHPEGVRRSCR